MHRYFYLYILSLSLMMGCTVLRKDGKSEMIMLPTVIAKNYVAPEVKQVKKQTDSAKLKSFSSEINKAFRNIEYLRLSLEEQKALIAEIRKLNLDASKILPMLISSRWDLKNQNDSLRKKQDLLYEIAKEQVAIAINERNARLKQEAENAIEVRQAKAFREAISTYASFIFVPFIALVTFYCLVSLWKDWREKRIKNLLSKQC